MKKQPAKGASATAPRPTKAKKSGSPRGSKTAFVLSLPGDMPAAEVVAKAKEAGLQLREKYVYNVRAAHRAKVRPSAGANTGRGAGAKSSSRLTDLEERFVDLALDIGFTRAEELFAEIRAKLKR